jgi:dolichol-phosphate mannosyltransferase
MEKFDLSIVIPAYMEEQNLRLLAPRLKTTAGATGLTFEIIIVDTQEPMDLTKELCDEFTLRYIPRKGDNSYGSAVRTGIESSRGKHVIFMDADGSHNPEFIPELLNLKDQFDIVIASRYIKGGNTENSPILILMSKMVNWGFSFVLNIKCKDISNSFKLYPGDQLRELKLRCDNFDIVEEILYKLIKNNKGISIKEIPFSFKQRMFGLTKRNLFKFVFTYFVTLIKLRFFI